MIYMYFGIILALVIGMGKGGNDLGGWAQSDVRRGKRGAWIYF